MLSRSMEQSILGRIKDTLNFLIGFLFFPIISILWLLVFIQDILNK
jgi:hypothetical protein